MTTVNGRKQVIVSATRESVGYDFETGKRIWWARGLGQNTIPQPIAADGLVFVMSGYRNPNLMAIRLGRTGDLTGTDAIVWENQRGNSYTPSPVLHDGILYLLTDSGMLSALDAKTGKPHYAQQRLPKPYQFKASPVGANGKLYLATENDDVVVVQDGADVRGAGDEYAEGPDVHRDTGDCRRRALPARSEHVVCDSLKFGIRNQRIRNAHSRPTEHSKF